MKTVDVQAINNNNIYSNLLLKAYYPFYLPLNNLKTTLSFFEITYPPNNLQQSRQGSIIENGSLYIYNITFLNQ